MKSEVFLSLVPLGIYLQIEGSNFDPGENALPQAVNK